MFVHVISDFIKCSPPPKKKNSSFLSSLIFQCPASEFCISPLYIAIQLSSGVGNVCGTYHQRRCPPFLYNWKGIRTFNSPVMVFLKLLSLFMTFMDMLKHNFLVTYNRRIFYHFRLPFSTHFQQLAIIISL